MIRLAIIGTVLGSNPGYHPSVGENLARLLIGEGYPVIISSAALKKYNRLLDILKTLIIYRKQIDIQVLQVYSGLSFITTDLASLIGKIFGHKLIFHIHGGAFPDFLARYPLWVRSVLNRADAIVVPSPYLVHYLGEKGYTVQVIPNCIELMVYHHHHRHRLRPNLFWMRSFHHIYNPEMAIRVLARLRNVIPSATMVMAGSDKGSQDSVCELARLMNLTNAVTFPGYLDMEGKNRYAMQNDIFINTSYIDNMPVSVIEACAFGLPVVTTNVGGIQDLLNDGETGLLISKNDDQSMAEAVMRLISDHVLAGRLSENGRKLAERFAWENVYPSWEQLFSGMISK